MDKIMEKLDSMESKLKTETEVSISEKVAAVTAKMDAAEQAFADKVAALEAKVASIQAPTIIKPAAGVRVDVNRNMREQLATFHKSNSRSEKELQIFSDESQHAAYMAEASSLAGSGDGKGGRTGYDPIFAALRLANPLRGIARTVVTDGSSYQLRVKTGNAGAQWGYGIQNNGTPTTEDTAIWQVVMKDLNVQFPVRTAALDDIDGLESTIVDDMLAEFAQTEAIGMIANNDQSGTGTTVATGGADGVRGLNQYPGANSTFTGGTTSAAAFGTSGTGSTAGLHSMATYDQLASNVNTVGANNIAYKDVINLVYALPQQYWTATAKFMISPILLQAIRGLVDSQGRPIYVDGLSRNDGIVGSLLGFDIVVNKYLDTPSQTATAAAGTVSKYPMFFGDFNAAYSIVDRMSMVLRRYDQTLPGSITFFGEKRLATSVRDPNAIVRYRSTGTAAA